MGGDVELSSVLFALDGRLAKRDDFVSDMAHDIGTTKPVQVLLRCADCEVLAAAARLRKQSLQQFVSEVLAVTAADLRTPPRAAITWLDIYARHPQLAPDEDEADIKWTMPRPPRPARLSSGPTPRNR